MKIDTELLSRVLAILDRCDQHENLWWWIDADGLHLGVNCSDEFWWGTADSEEITPENVAVLEQSYADAAAAMRHGEVYGDSLFAARVRRLRPQGACYRHYPEPMWPLFDAAGPERDPREPGNTPRPTPEEARDRQAAFMRDVNREHLRRVLDVAFGAVNRAEIDEPTWEALEQVAAAADRRLPENWRITRTETDR